MEDLLANSSKVFAKEEEKTLTLKSLEKQVNEKFIIIDDKIKQLEWNIELLKKVARR